MLAYAYQVKITLQFIELLLILHSTCTRGNSCDAHRIHVYYHSERTLSAHAEIVGGTKCMITKMVHNWLMVHPEMVR